MFTQLHYESSTSNNTTRTNDSEREKETQQSGADTSSTDGSIDKKSQPNAKQAVLYTWFMLTSPPKVIIRSIIGFIPSNIS